MSGHRLRSGIGTDSFPGSEIWAMYTPSTWAVTDSLPVVLMAHGSGGTGAFALPDVDACVHRVGRRLAENGYLALSADWGGAQNWGNDASIARIDAVLTWLAARGGKCGAATDKIGMVGVSMGGITTLNWARVNKARIAGWTGIIPCVDLNAIYQNAVFQGSIGTAYGVTYPTALPGLATHSPVLYQPDLTGFPMDLWASDNDNTVYNTAAHTTFAAGVGPNALVHSMGSIGHTTPTDVTLQDAIVNTILTRWSFT